MLCGARAQGILADVHVYNKPLTARVKLVLLVVNSIKLHFTALNFDDMEEIQCLRHLTVVQF